jgi:hypothetical protein
MKNHTRRFLGGLVVIGIVLALMAPARVFAEPNPHVIQPHKDAYPMTYGEWSARWWQYVFGLPQTDHPLTDGTGERCAVGQWGPVFFLMGTTGGSAVRPACTAPAGKALLLPILNVACAIPEDGNDHAAITNLCTQIADAIDVGTLSVSIDGKAVKNPKHFRFRSPTFSFTGEKPNVVSTIGCGTPPCYEGFRETAVADGYWILVKPLSAGKHDIRFHGEIPAFGFAVDVTYHLTVLP